MKNYYSILGVTPDSTFAEIKSAYKTLARKYHPDINPVGAQKFKDISEAYSTLCDEKKRIQYDTINGFFKTKKTETSSEKAQQEYKKTASEPIKKEKFYKKFDDIFPKKKKVDLKHGKDINEEISITIKESINGCERVINVLSTTECPHCKGRKFINGTICSVCAGTGEKSELKKITVKIPKNVKNGAKLRIPNEGEKGENGGKNGDLYLKINIEENPRIQIEDNNMIFKVPITPFEAVLGGNISIPSFDGNLSLKIPAKTNSGQKFRLAGQGLKKNGKIGDLIIIVDIEIPSSLSDDEIRLYEKLKKLSAQNLRENLWFR